MKPFKVVCITDSYICFFKPNAIPVKGEIYTVIAVNKSEKYQTDYYQISELAEDEEYICTMFRPVDESFGEWVESTLMKEVELESVTINQ